MNKAKDVLTSCPFGAFIPVKRDTQHGNYELMQGKNIERNSGRKGGSGGLDRMVREVLSKVTLVIPRLLTCIVSDVNFLITLSGYILKPICKSCLWNGCRKEEK